MNRFFKLIICVGFLLFVSTLSSCKETKNNEQHEHSYGDYQIILDATCTEDGSKKRVCSCGNEEIEEIPATGHVYGKWEVLDATCTEDGSKKRVCSCGDEEIEEIPATGHVYGRWEVLDATCTKDGSKKRVCSCGDEEIEEMPATGHDFEDVECQTCGYYMGSEGLIYELNTTTNEYFLKSFGSCIEKDVVITNVINDKPVTSIAGNAFEGCKDIISIKIPSSIKKIGEYAFKGCNSIENIVIPNSVTNIGLGAFSGCSSLTSITLPFVGESIKTKNDSNQYPFGYIFGSEGYENGNIIGQLFVGNANQNMIGYCIPKGLTDVTITGGNILLGAFYNCSNIKNVTLPADLLELGSHTFYNCSSLEKVEFNEDSSLKTIGEYTFYGCNKLQSINLPSLLEVIEKNAFSSSGIKSIVIPKSVNSIKEQAFYYSKIEDVVFEKDSNLSIISESTFSGCSNLKSVVLPNKLNEIRANAFYYCSSLKDISIPSTVTSIGAYAFSNSALSMVVFLEESNLRNIEKDAFSGCSNLVEIDIPDSVISIGESAFEYCFNLEKVNIKETSKLEHIDKYAFYECEKINVIVIPQTVTLINDDAFEDCNSLIEVYNLSNLDIKIGSEENGFVGYYALVIHKSINEPSSIVETTDGFRFVFIDAKYKLIGYKGDNTTVRIPDNINNSIYSIGTNAFYKSKIKNIILPKNITDFEKNSFNSCSSLESVYYEGTIEDWCKIEFFDYTSTPMNNADNFYMKDTDGNYQMITNIVIPNTIKEIKPYTFFSFNNITSFTLPVSVEKTNIGSFSTAGILESIYYEGTIEDWCKIEFTGTDANPMGDAERFYIKDSNNVYKEVTEIIVPSSITEIGVAQFYGFNNVTSIVLPNSIKIIGEYAFVSNGFVNITLSKGIEIIKTNAFNLCSKLKNVYYDGEIIDWLGIEFEAANSNPMNYAKSFYMKDENDEYAEVTEIVVPGTVLKINNYSFYGFTNVTSIIIEEGVLEIGEKVFYRCGNLKSVVVASTVKTIGKYAFYGCEYLTINFVSESLPDDCDPYWNSENRPVNFGYKE